MSDRCVCDVFYVLKEVSAYATRFVNAKLAQSWGARRVIGVDIDETLIRAAWKRRRAIWSLQGPISDPSADESTDEPNKKRMKTEEDLPQDTSNLADYFPASCEHMFGPLPIPPSTSHPHLFPHNVVFQTADWVNSEIAEDAQGYNVVVA